MHQLKSMKEMLITQVQGQMGHLESVDSKELGEVIDMIKDLSEAIYYCTITEAMEEKDKSARYQMPMYFMERPYYPDYRELDRRYGRMYYDGDGSRSNGGSNRGNNARGGGSRGFDEYPMMPYAEREYPLNLRDYREGRSPMNRKMYMESKELHHDKAVQMKELEKYV